jgi:hypothetical protein
MSKVPAKRFLHLAFGGALGARAFRDRFFIVSLHRLLDPETDATPRKR